MGAAGIDWCINILGVILDISNFVFYKKSCLRKLATEFQLIPYFRQKTYEKSLCLPSNSGNHDYGISLKSTRKLVVIFFIITLITRAQL